MITFTPRLAAMAGTAVLAAGAALVLPTYAAQATNQSCVQSTILYSCDYVNGSGLHINYIRGTVTNQDGTVENNIHIEISGPHGAIKNCGQVNLGGGASTTCTWSPNANETAGNYCTDTWQYNPSTKKYTDRGHACVNVHS